jgi:antiviral helicase SLH1
MWSFDNPLRQFSLQDDVLHRLVQYGDDYSPTELVQMTAAELAQLTHLNEKHGAALLAAAQQFPTARITYDLRPLGFDVLKIAIHLERAFKWNTRLHGVAEPFWLWAENEDGTSILQSTYLSFREATVILDTEFIISIPLGKLPSSITLRFVSERWIGAEEEERIPLDKLVMPKPFGSHTPRLDLPFLDVSVCGNTSLQRSLSGRLSNFNAIQTQIAWSVLKTRSHSLICSPKGSGKSLIANISVLYVL